MRQVWMNRGMFWSNILDENEKLIVAQDFDGVMTYVVKDGTQQTRGGKE